MTVTVTDLLARVAPFRPDLKEEMAIFAVNEAVRNISQNAQILKKSVYGNHTYNGDVLSPLAGLTDNLNRIETVSALKLPSGAHYSGNWDADANSPVLPDPLAADQGDNTVKAGPNAAETLYYPVACKVAPNKIIVSGKPTGSGASAKTPFYLFDAVAGTFTKIADINGYRFYSTNTLPQHRNIPATPDGAMWVIGGDDGTTGYTTNSYLLYPDGTIDPGPTLTDVFGTQPGRYYSRVLRLPDGRMAFYPGYDNTGTGQSLNIRLLIWDPVTNVTSVTPDTATQFNALYSGACVASNGSILFAPGITNSTDPDKFYIFNVDTNAWSLAATSAITRYNSGIAGLGNDLAMIDIGNGKVMVCGGNLTAGKAIEIYDCVNSTVTKLCDAWSASTACSRASFTVIDAINGLYLLTAYKNPSWVSYVVDVKNATTTQVTFPVLVDRTNGATVTTDGYKVWVFGGNSATNLTQYYYPKLTANTGSWYHVTSGTTNNINGSSQWFAGDVIYSNGTSWVRYNKSKFVELHQDNIPYRNTSLKHVDNMGDPQVWMQENGVMRFDPIPDAEYPLNITVSYSPVYAVDAASIPIPSEAEQVIVDTAMAYMFALPGEGSSPKMAMEYRRLSKIGLQKLQAIAFFGYGGSPQYVTGPFAGRQTFNLANWYK